MIYTCCDENRKAAILSSASIALNGIDYLEVVDATATAPPSLLIHCLKAAPTTLTPANIMILGGESITGITAVSVAVGTGPTVLTVQTNQSGDFSTYTLRLVNSATPGRERSLREYRDVLEGFDPQLAEVTVLLQGRVRSGFRLQRRPDRLQRCRCRHAAADQLSGQGLRQLSVPCMLDRLSQLAAGVEQRRARPTSA